MVFELVHLFGGRCVRECVLEFYYPSRTIFAKCLLASCSVVIMPPFRMLSLTLQTMVDHCLLLSQHYLAYSLLLPLLVLLLFFWFGLLRSNKRGDEFHCLIYFVREGVK